MEGFKTWTALFGSETDHAAGEKFLCWANRRSLGRAPASLAIRISNGIRDLSGSHPPGLAVGILGAKGLCELPSLAGSRRPAG